MSRFTVTSLAHLFLLLGLVWLGACGDDPAGSPDVQTDAGEDVAEDPNGDTAPDVPPDTAPDVPDVSQDPDVPPDANTDIPVADGDAGDVTSDRPIRIVAVSPSRGPELGGTEILIIGLGFTFETDVYLGSALCQNIDVVDDTKITCRTPANPAGSYEVKVINDLGLDSLPNAFTYFAPLRVFSVDPERGPTTGGMPTIVNGEGFGPGTQVSVGGRVGLGIEVVDSRTLRFLTPPGTAGLHTVRVVGLNGLATLNDGFEYYDPVRVEHVLPGSGPASGGREVVIHGTGFTTASDMSVTFGLLAGTNLQIVDSRTLVVTAPPGPGDTAVDLTVQSALNGAHTVLGGFYYYASSDAFALHHLAPRRGSADGGDEVVLSGLGLDSATTVTFGAAAATIIDRDATWLLVETPPHAVGVVSVSVSGAGTATLTNAFTYVEPVRILSITPNAGDVAGGDAVTLTGAGFLDGTLVRIGALFASNVTIVNATTLTAVTPPGAVGPADVWIETPDGVEATLRNGFTYTSPVLVLGF
jgi:hypothetical protein